MNFDRFRGRAPSGWIALALLLALPATARAQNGLTNPDFDTSVAGWSAVDGALAWNGGLDVHLCAGSGSASYSAPEMVAGKWTITAASSGSCVPVTPGELIAVRVRLLLTAIVANTDIALYAYTDGTCTAGESERGLAGYSFLPIQWMDLMLGVTVDSGVHSVRLLLRTTDTSVSSYGFALDRTYVGRYEPIFLDGLDAASTCRWNIAVP